MSRLRSNKVVNQAGSGAPELTYGAVIPNTGTISGAGKVSIGGSITAGSFHGDGSGLSGVGDPSALKDGSNVKVQAISTGANVTGNLAATGNVTAVDGTFSGNLTVQGTTTTIDTAVTSVDSLAVDGNVGIGLTTPSQRFEVSDNTQSDVTVGDLLVNTTGLGATVLVGRLSSRSNDNTTFRVRDRIDNTILSASPSVPLIIGRNGSEFLRVNNDGTVGINSTAPRTSLDIKSTDAVVVPVGTTAQRPTPAAGMFRYNTTEGKFEGYTTEWGEIGGGGGITTEAHVANNAVVTLDLTAAVDHKVTATGICTITCTGGTEAQSHTIRIINSGSATVGFSTYFLFPSGNTPVLTSTAGAINLISFTVNRVGAAGTQLLAGASLNFS